MTLINNFIKYDKLTVSWAIIRCSGLSTQELRFFFMGKSLIETGLGPCHWLLHCCWECKLTQPFWMSVWWFLRKLGNNLPQDPAIPLLGIYPKDAHSCHKDMCSAMFIAVFFVIDRNWKQPKCPLIEEWRGKMWYIYTMEYYTAVKNNDILNFAGKWMELENIILSEVTQIQKDNYHMYSLIGGF